MKKDLTLPTLVSMVVLLAFSSVGATYAWYQYNANVIIDYNGTSIGSSTVFEVGLVSETPLEGYEDYGLVREQIGDKDVYWCASEVTTNISKYYLSSNGYATDRLNAVTSGKFSEGDPLSLKANPTYNDNYVMISDRTSFKEAERKNYAHFSLAFKVNTVSPDGVQTVDASKVSLKSADLDSDGNLSDAIRIHFNSGDSSIIFNPSSIVDGKDLVGGILDLNNDGAYDFHPTRNGDFETVYGEYEDLSYNSFETSDGIVPTLLSGDGDSFNAQHCNGVYGIDSSKSVFSTSSFVGSHSVIDGGKCLAETGSNGLAYLDMDIYLEGWSHSFIDAEMGHKFGLGLEFECK